MLPEVAVTTRSLSPTGVDDVVVTMNRDVPVPFTVAGTNIAVAPVGRPPDCRVTTPANDVLATVSMTPALPPGETVSLDEAAERANVSTVSSTLVL